MLPPQHRLRRRRDFEFALRSGQRAGSKTLIAHLALRPESPAPAQVGFVVGRAVGGAVVRNRVRRRLRALARCRLAELPDGVVFVIRALPASATADSALLRTDLDGVLSRLTRGKR